MKEAIVVKEIQFNKAGVEITIPVDSIIDVYTTEGYGSYQGFLFDVFNDEYKLV